MDAEIDAPEISLLDGRVRIMDAFYGTDLLEDLYNVLCQIFLPPSTFYISNSLLKRESECVRQLADYIPRPLGMFVHLHLNNLRSRLSIEEDAPGGWEVWSRVSTSNSPSFGYLHVDNDELMRSRFGRLISPDYGSILYVGPRSEIYGGETAFIDPAAITADQLFSKRQPEDFSAVPFIFVKPIVGRLAVFDGKLPHAVMWTKGRAAQPRITLLANYWKNRILSVPHGVCSVTK